MPYIEKPRRLLEHWQAERDNFEEAVCANNRCDYCVKPNGIYDCKTECLHPGSPSNSHPDHYEPDDYPDYVMKSIRDLCKGVGGHL